MELTIELPDLIAEKLQSRADRQEFVQHAVTLALDEKSLRLPSHLEITPGIAGGKPRIAGHRITVQDVVTWHELQGRSVDEISADYGITPAEVHAALTYYFDHREEITQAMREGESFVESLRRNTPSKLQQKLKGRVALRGQESPGEEVVPYHESAVLVGTNSIQSRPCRRA